jgi:sugar lactone lactonase YvrE
MLPRNRLLVTLALAWAVAFASFHHPAAWAEVVVLAGSAAGRVGKEPDAAKVNEPFAVAFDAEGRMYGVEYTRGNRLFRVAKPAAAKDKPESAGSEPQVEFLAGMFYVPAPKQTLPPDTATAAGEVRFHGLHDVAIGPDGTVYVADTFNHRIRAFDPKSGTVRVVAGTGVSGFAGDGGPATVAQFNQAYCGTLLPDGAAMLVADIGNARLRRIDLVAGTVESIVGNGQRGRPVDGAKALETPLAGPRAACQAKDGTIYLALREGNALVEIKQGVVRTVVNAAGKGGYGGDGGPGRDALLAGPKYVAFDRAGRVLIADTENHCIRRYDPASGTIELVAGTPPRGGATVGTDLLSTQLLRPHGCCLDPLGRLVIADSDNDRIIVGDLPASN